MENLRKILSKIMKNECAESSKIVQLRRGGMMQIDIGAFHYARPSTVRLLNAASPFKKMLVFKCKVSFFQFLSPI